MLKSNTLSILGLIESNDSMDLSNNEHVCVSCRSQCRQRPHHGNGMHHYWQRSQHSGRGTFVCNVWRAIRAAGPGKCILEETFLSPKMADAPLIQKRSYGWDRKRWDGTEKVCGWMGETGGGGWDRGQGEVGGLFEKHLHNYVVTLLVGE